MSSTSEDEKKGLVADVEFVLGMLERYSQVLEL